MLATRCMNRLVLLALCLLLAGPLCAQKQQHEPLTEKQIDQIAEAGIEPNARLALYTKFVNEHMDVINGLAKRANTEARNHKIASELEDLTALMDELNSNIDTYAERKADIRRSLKALIPAVDRWHQTLRALLAETSFELARKEAIESAQDLADETQRLHSEQNAYFEQHKDEAGQDRWEPHP